MSDSNIHVQLKILLEKLESDNVSDIALNDKPPEFSLVVLSRVNELIKNNRINLVDLEFDANHLPQELLFDLLTNIFKVKNSIKILKIYNLEHIIKNNSQYNQFINILKSNINVKSLTIESSIPYYQALEILSTPNLNKLSININSSGYAKNTYSLFDIYDSFDQTKLKAIDVILEGDFPKDHIDMFNYRLEGLARKNVSNKIEKKFNLSISNKNEFNIKESNKKAKQKGIDDKTASISFSTSDSGKSNLYKNLFYNTESSSDISKIKADISESHEFISDRLSFINSQESKIFNPSIKKDNNIDNNLNSSINTDIKNLKQKFIEEFIDVYWKKYNEINEDDDLKYDKDKHGHINIKIQQYLQDAFKQLGYNLDNEKNNNNIISTLKNTNSDFFIFKPQDFKDEKLGKTGINFKKNIKATFGAIIRKPPPTAKSGR